MPTSCWRRYGPSASILSPPRQEADMSTTTKPPKTPQPPNRLAYAVIGVLVAVLLAGTGAFLWLGNSKVGGLAIGGPFTLEDGNAKPVTDRDFRGKYMLVYFGYTFC